MEKVEEGNRRPLILSDDTFFQARIDCKLSETCGGGDGADCDLADKKGVCASSYPPLAEVPGSNQCCCPPVSVSLAHHIVPSDASVTCHHQRQCKFTCCDMKSPICGDNCCRKDELCGERLDSGDACCVAPNPLVKAALDASEFPQLYKDHLQQTCCPFGRGIVCLTGSSCCLDVTKGCSRPNECPSKKGSALGSILLGVTTVFTLVAIFVVMVKIAQLARKIILRRQQSVRNQAEEANLTSGGMYGDDAAASGLLSRSQQRPAVLAEEDNMPTPVRT